MKKLWFKRKLYGWGWYPSTWEGWALIGLYLVAISGLSLTIDESASLTNALLFFMAPVFVLTALLIWICYKTGESPRWQWGPPKDK
jgi:hypothetical protein